MAPLATTRTVVRRLTDPDRPRLAVVLLALASALLLGGVWIALPGPAEGTSAPVLSVEDTPATPANLVSGPTSIVLPMPEGEEDPTARVLVNHLEEGVTVQAQLANGDGLMVDLSDAGPRATEVTIRSERVHVCDRYAGSLVLEASHESLPSDLLVLDVRHADCGEVEPLTAAPSSVNDTSQTWGDDGRAPWRRNPAPPPPPPPAPEPPPPPPTEPEPEPETEPAPVQEEAVEEVDLSEPEPEPEPTTTTEPEPEPDPTTTTEPEPEPEPTATSEPTTDDGGDGGGDTATAEPTATETSTEN